MATSTAECIRSFFFTCASVTAFLGIFHPLKYSHTEESQIVRIAAAPNLSPPPPLDGRLRALGNR
jgi:hypothetical protein